MEPGQLVIGEAGFEVAEKHFVGLLFHGHDRDGTVADAGVVDKNVYLSEGIGGAGHGAVDLREV